MAVGIPALLLGGAYIGQYGFGLYPCEMCWWQRYPHFTAIALGLLAYVAPKPRMWTALAAVAIFVSGAIGLAHAGVEYGWWEGFTACALLPSNTGGGDALDAIMGAPLVRCDAAPWDLFGISLAGWNFLLSTAGAIAILALLARRKVAA